MRLLSLSPPPNLIPSSFHFSKIPRSPSVLQFLHLPLPFPNQHKHTQCTHLRPQRCPRGNDPRLRLPSWFHGCNPLSPPTFLLPGKCNFPLRRSFLRLGPHHRHVIPVLEFPNIPFRRCQRCGAHIDFYTSGTRLSIKLCEELFG